VNGYNLEEGFKELLQRAIERGGANEHGETIKLHSPIDIERLTGKKRSRCC
jgi:hypothetical protein